MDKKYKENMMFNNIFTKGKIILWIIGIIFIPIIARHILRLKTDRMSNWLIKLLIVGVFILFITFLFIISVGIYEVFYFIECLIIWGKEKHRGFAFNVKSKDLHSALYYSKWNRSPINYIFDIIDVNFVDLKDISRDEEIDNYLLFTFLVNRLKLFKVNDLERMKTFLNIEYDSLSKYINFSLVVKMMYSILILVFMVFTVKGIYFLSPEDLSNSKNIVDIISGILKKFAPYIKQISSANLLLGISIILIVFVFFPILYLIDKIRLQNAKKVILTAINVALKELS